MYGLHHETYENLNQYESTISIYECENCSGCEYKSKCTKAKGNKQLHVAKNFIRLRKRSLKNITILKNKLFGIKYIKLNE